MSVVVMVYALISVEHVFELPQTTISLILKKVVALQLVLNETVLQLSSLVHLMQMVDQVNRIRMLVYLFLPQLLLCDLPNVFFDLFDSLLKDLYILQ